MKIVVLDGYTENPGDLAWESLEKLGDLTVYDRTSMTDVAEIVSRIGDAEIVVTNKTPITKEVFDRCSNIEFIAVLATGFNVVDVEYAREKGVSVSNVPAYGTEAVAQFAIGMLLEICHHVAHHSKTVYEGKWENCPDFCYWDYPLIELKDKTMGIIGFGRIGQQTGRIAKAMGMNILATGSRETAEGKEIATYVDLDTLLESSDVIALHCPLVLENTGMINKDTIAKMKDGVIILNNSRGPLIVEQDLCDALNSGKVLAAGVDVVATEPIKGDNPLLKAKNCFITPHISWASVECRQRIMDTTAQNIEAHLKGQEINVVNA